MRRRTIIERIVVAARPIVAIVGGIGSLFAANALIAPGRQDRIGAGRDRVGEGFGTQQFLGGQDLVALDVAGLAHADPGCECAQAAACAAGHFASEEGGRLQAWRRPSISAAPSAKASVASTPSRLMLNHASLENGSRLECSAARARSPLS